MILGDGHLAETARAAFGDVPWVWACFDTPILPDGRSDVETVVAQVSEALVPLRAGDFVVLTSQLPVGTCARFEGLRPDLRFAVVPENIREADGPEAWRQQRRHVIGLRDWRSDASAAFRALLSGVLERSSYLLYMEPESAELVKHVLNAWLALSVTYAQEVATLVRVHGGDPEHVAAGVMSDPRVGPTAYLRPGGTVSPHQLREVLTLQQLGGGKVIEAVLG